MKRFIFSIAVILLCNIKITAQCINCNLFPKKSAQVLFVKTSNDSSTTGELFLYQRSNKKGKWKIVDSFHVTVGRSGLAWDEKSGLLPQSGAVTKKEGDGKSPAGIFKLGPVFSYNKIDKIKMPFQQVDTTDICVDDAGSIYYNRLIDVDTLAYKDWNSFEYMHRNDALYEYGVWVQYNSDKIFAGKGSCIFLHVWNNNSTPTSGCTAMSKENMIKIIHWLDARKNPVLVQVVDNRVN